MDGRPTSNLWLKAPDTGTPVYLQCAHLNALHVCTGARNSKQVSATTTSSFLIETGKHFLARLAWDVKADVTSSQAGSINPPSLLSPRRRHVLNTDVGLEGAGSQVGRGRGKTWA